MRVRRAHPGYLPGQDVPISVWKGESAMQDDVRASGHEVQAASGPRLRVTNRLPTEHIDGAWWPRSTDLVAELPPLLAAVSDRLGQVVAVGYRRGGWNAHPSEVDFAGHPVELLGFDSAEPPGVIVIGHDGHHLTLRVIPPGTSEPVARQELQAIPERSGGTAGQAASAVARSVADVADRLARHEGSGDDHRNAEILQWCEQAAEQFEGARIQSFVPILVEHVVRDRMLQSRHTATVSPSDTDSGKPQTGG